MFSRRKTGSPSDAPHIEVWGHLVETNVFLRRTSIVCIAFGFCGLALAAYGVDIALHRPLAFHVSDEGQASFVGRLRDAVAPTDAEVRFVAKDFVKHYMALSSLTIESDLSDAWNLMTESLRAEHERMLADFAKERGEDFVSNLRKQGIQTVLLFDDKRTEILTQGGKQLTVHLHGSARVWPLNRVGEDAAYEERTFDAHLLLVRCARTELTPNGLLVAQISRRFTVPDAKELSPLASPKEK